MVIGQELGLSEPGVHGRARGIVVDGEHRGCLLELDAGFVESTGRPKETAQAFVAERLALRMWTFLERGLRHFRGSFVAERPACQIGRLPHPVGAPEARGARSCGIPELERSLEMRDRDAGRNRFRGVGRVEKGSERRFDVSGAVEVEGELAGLVGTSQHIVRLFLKRIRYATVKAGTLGRQKIVVDDFANQRMPESVRARPSFHREDLCVDAGSDCGLEGVAVEISDAREQLVVGVSAHHCGSR